jgi:predicted metal-dependent HD superfamily phosphohydrolase
VAHDQLTRLGIPNDKIARCQQQIIATKEHQYNSDNDTNYLVDMDLAILGESPEIYKDYSGKIREEYAVYPDFLYKKGRKKVLQHFLGMGIIFKTEEFRDIYEQQARENLNTELQEL